MIKKKCGNCLYFGKVTHHCYCHTNKRVKKRTRHESSPYCSGWVPEFFGDWLNERGSS